MKYQPAPVFWACASASLLMLSFSISGSLLNSHSYKIETENHKLKINLAVQQVKEVSDTLKKSVELLPSREQEEITREINRVDENLLKTQQEILTDEKHSQDGEEEI